MIQSEAHLNDEIMEYFWKRIDKQSHAPCHQWVGPLSHSRTTKAKYVRDRPTPRFQKQIDGQRFSFTPHTLIYNYHHYPNEKSPLGWNKGRGDEIRRMLIILYWGQGEILFNRVLIEVQLLLATPMV